MNLTSSTPAVLDSQLVQCSLSLKIDIYIHNSGVNIEQHIGYATSTSAWMITNTRGWWFCYHDLNKIFFSIVLFLCL